MTPGSSSEAGVLVLSARYLELELGGRGGTCREVGELARKSVC